MSHDIPLTVAVALAAGMAIQLVARSIRVPAIILLLATGVALGPEGLGWVHPRDLGLGLFVLVDFGVAIILFEGALNLKGQRLRREERVIRRLITVGALVTLAGGALAARYWLAWPWSLSLLFGSLVVVTGPTVVGPLVRDLRLQPRLQTILEAEGVLIDPIGALLAVLVLQITLAPDALSVLGEFGSLLGRLAVGVALGVAGGFLIGGLLRLPALVHGFENALTLALVVALFHVSDYVLAPSGLLAVTVAGLVVGNMKTRVDEDLREFKDQLTVLMIGALFVLLAADIGLAEVTALGWGGVLVLLTLIVFVRPISVLISTIGIGMQPKQVLFISMIAPRGIVAAAVASITAGLLNAQGIPGGTELRALVFLVIAGTVIFAGAAAWPAGAALGLRLPGRDRVAILGAQGLGIALGRELREAGHSVVFVDSDPRRCRVVEDEGFSVVFGDALHERTLRRLPIELVGTAIGATFNDNLNSQFVGLAHESFGVKRGLAGVDTFDAGAPPQHVVRQGADVLFDGPHDQERWDVRWRQGQIEIVRATWSEEGRSEPEADGDRRSRAERELFVVLTIARGERTQPAAWSLTPKPGDTAAVAVFTASRDEAIEAMAAAGWRLTDD